MTQLLTNSSHWSSAKDREPWAAPARSLVFQSLLPCSPAYPLAIDILSRWRRLELIMGRAGPETEEFLSDGCSVLLAVLCAQTPPDRNSLKGARKSHGELRCPGLKIPVGSKDLQLNQALLEWVLSVMRWKSPNHIHKYSSVGRACVPG